MSRFVRLRRRLCPLGAVLALFCLPAIAQDAARLSSAELATLLDATRESTTLSDETRAPLVLQLQEAGKALERAEAFRKEAEGYRQAIEQGEDEVARYDALTRELETSTPTVADRVGRDPSLADIEAELDILNAQRATYAKQRSEALAARSDASKPEGDVQARLTEVSSQLQALSTPPAAGDTLEGRIANAAQRARRQALEAERAMLELKVRGAPAVSAIRAEKIAWLDAALEQTDALLADLRDAAAASRQSVVQQRKAEIRNLIAPLDDNAPALSAFAEGNIALLDAQERLSDDLARARRRSAELRDGLEYIEQDFSLTKRRVEVAGLEGKLGQVLMTRLASLPSVREIERWSSEQNEQIAELSTESIDTDEALRRSGDRRAFLGKEVPGVDELGRQERLVLDKLYEQRRELLRSNLDAQNTLLRLLVDMNLTGETLITAIRDYQSFLTGNLLWIRNYRFLDPGQLGEQLLALGDPDPWLNLGRGWQRLLRSPPLVGGFLVLALLLLYRRRAGAMQQALLGVPIRPRDESARKIFQALLLGLIRCTPLPLALLLLALAVSRAGANAVDAEAVARGLGAAAAILFAFRWPLSLTDRIGTGRRMLKWNAQKIDALRSELLWLSVLVPVLAGLIAFARTQWSQDSGGPLAALATFTLSVSGVLVGLRLLRSRQFDGDRLARLLFRLFTFISAAIAAMHLSGQLFAAQMYLRAVALSIAAIAIILLVTNVLQRIVLIYRGRLERKQREALRAQAEAQAQAQPQTQVTEEDSEQPEQEVSDRDIDAVASLSAAQTQLLGAVRLVALAGFLWFIWSPALPAVTLLEEITLWTTTDPGLPEGELRAVSLATLIIAGAILVLTALLFRHLPPLVQVMLIEYGKVSAGARYAIGMLLQYLIIGVGASLSLSLVGFAWSKVQWLVAALGVGIGFGLQEIVANFISGIILLFERPIRVGDIISVSGYDGTVLDINPRATVIETFEGKELLIPNKDLITGVVNNWSLSSSKLRIVIPVGVAYGSDVRKAMRIVVEVARDNPAILTDPAPVATFEDFGDNALTLWLRCYAESDFIHRWTELRTEIYERLNKAGIGIAFPQRDVHLDAAEPIPVQLVERPVKGQLPDPS